MRFLHVKRAHIRAGQTMLCSKEHKIKNKVSKINARTQTK